MGTSPRRISQAQAIFVAMVAGLAVGFFWPHVAAALEPLSIIFIRLVKTIVVPIVFASLVVGIAGHGDLKAVGRIGVKALVYFELLTTVALAIGLLVANVMKPGVGVNLSAPGGDAAGIVAKQHSLSDFAINLVPENVVDAAARGDILEVVVFTVIFAIALSMAGEKKKPVLAFCESLSETMFKYTAIIMKAAPIGVGAAIAVIVGSKGIAVMLKLGLLVLSLYVGVLVFFAFVLLPVALLARVPLKAFLSAVKEPAMIAFSTTSSEAALPKAMENMIRLGVPREVVALVIPTGYSFNLDGTTLYLSLATLFVAQAAGIQLSVSQQLLVGLTLIFTSKGCAGVPRASLVVLAATLASFGLPVAGVAVILGVDALMDMARTATNVVGNCLASVVIARWEGVFAQPAAEGPSSAATSS